jgi:hypothetical protein
MKIAAEEIPANKNCQLTGINFQSLAMADGKGLKI